MLKINFSKRSQKFLKKLSKKQEEQIVRKVVALFIYPNAPDVKKLKGSEFLRADMGEYRIIYKITLHTIEIYVVGKRNDDEVYRRLERLL